MKCNSTLVFFLSLIVVVNLYGQGNHVFTTGEAANHGQIDLSTPGGQSWSTDRASLPGYFSALTGSSFTGSSDAANINGYVKKYGNETFTFPVGTGTDLRNVTINNTSGLATDAYSIAWILGNPSGNLDPTAPNSGAHPIIATGPGIVLVSPAGQWDWQVGAGGNLGTGTTGSGNGGGITVSIPDMSLFATTGNLRLVGWNGTLWIDLSGAATASGNTENSTLSGTMVPGITAIGIGSVSFVLPVKLVSFAAKEKNCMAFISWTTSGETDISKYEVEQSADGIRFKSVASVYSKNLLTAHRYGVNVAQQDGDIYYRLKIINTDGSFEYSDIISLKVNCTASKDFISLYPNPVIPVSSDITVRLKLNYAGKASISVTNNFGQQLMIQPIAIANGSGVYKLNSSKLNAGLYYLNIMDESGKKLGSTQQFIKQ